MPLEIRELLIRVSVREKSITADPASDNLKERLQEMKNRIIKECIDKVMERIEKTQDR